MTKTYGIIGYPVKHSLSPTMHNATFKALGIDAVYESFEVKPQDLEKAIKDLAESGVCGFNVTIPHKTACMKFLDSIDKDAERIGAVNTVDIKNKKLFGYNTDGPGFLRSLKEDLGFAPEGKNIFIIGAGGAARAVVCALAKIGAGSITIVDKVKEKAIELSGMRSAGCPLNHIDYEESWQPFARQAQLLVNASPVGMKDSDPVPIDTDLLHNGLVVFDLVYNRETDLIKAARKKGLKACAGLGMLLYQGVEAFEIWTGRKAPVEIMRQALTQNRQKVGDRF